ncbi:hypothetical protein HGRIS_013859 [Hohenbuehelia grisea]|uniref:BTB domain-containing protein n=1 Tax=Hohenbuehelia grisea TaxID=104357 RepID=A0ABR3IWW0_9AGAR
MAARPAKRLRSVGAQEVRDDELYYPDGNIVLAIESTGTGTGTAEAGEDQQTCTTYFRVHRSVLAKQSVVFEGMFTLPEGTEAQETYDDTTQVRLHDDVGDVKSLLKLFYKPFYIPSARYQSQFLCNFLGPLKLAAKYMIPGIRQEVIARLKVDWPADLAGADRRADELLGTKVRPNPQWAIRLIRAGALHAELFRELAVMYFDAEFGIQRVANFGFDDANDYKVVICAHAKLNAILARVTVERFSCKAHHADHYAIQIALMAFLLNAKSTMELVFRIRPEIEAIRRGSVRVLGHDLCRKCALQLAKQLEGLRQEVYEALPKIFDTEKYQLADAA